MKPEGHNAVSPYLIVAGADRVIRFLQDAFDAEVIMRHENPDGTILHAEVRIDDSVVMMGEAGGEWSPAPAHLHVYVRDVDATYRRALDAGGTPVREPATGQNDTDRRGGVRDAAGNTWWVATARG